MKLTTLDILPTTVCDITRERFHPGIRNLLTVAYWPNITFEREDDAYQFAREQVQDAIHAANEIVTAWNLKTIGERHPAS